MKAFHAVLGVTLLAAPLLVAAPARADSLVSVGFLGTTSLRNPTMFGLEPVAAAADPVFAGAFVWNGLPFPFPALAVNPTFSGLVDSTGTKTSVGFSITGNVIAYSQYNAVTNPDALRAQYLAWNSNNPGFGESDAITWQLTGLTPNSSYDMFVYGARADVNRSFNMTIEGTTLSVATLALNNPLPPGGTLFSNLHSDASGRISGIGTGVGSDVGFLNEANWSGFQVAPTPAPEPNSPILLGTGLLTILLTLAWKKIG
jgi:hypothetical protein